MKLRHQISENEMVATFVAAEFNSARFGKTTRRIAKEFGVSPSVILNPNLKSTKENVARRAILGEWRGFESRTKLFECFPDRVKWYKATLDRSDFGKLHYGRSPKYWDNLSNGTQKVSEGVKYIYGMPRNSNPARFVRSIYRGIVKGESFPPIIVLTDPRRSRLVLVEGACRSTAHCKAIQDGIIKKMNVLLGVSSQIEKWALW